MATSPLERELKRGSTEVLILALFDQRQRHGYEISQLIILRGQRQAQVFDGSMSSDDKQHDGRQASWCEPRMGVPRCGRLVG